MVDDKDNVIDVAYEETGPQTYFEVSASEFSRREYTKQLRGDRLFQGLSDDEKRTILSDDIAQLDPQRYYSLSDVASMLAAFPWVPDRITDATLRHWFNADVSGLEEYVMPEKNGRKRLLSLISFLRMKLISYWHYGKKFSLEQVNDLVFDVEKPMMKEWTSTTTLTLNDLPNLRVPSDKLGEFMAWYTEQVIQVVSSAYNPMEQTIQKIRKDLGLITERSDTVNDLQDAVKQQAASISQVQNQVDSMRKQAQLTDNAKLNDELRVLREVWKVDVTEECRIEALQLWSQSPNRFQKQLFGLLKVENTVDKELYVANYIKLHLDKKIEDRVKEYVKNFREQKNRMREETQKTVDHNE